MKINGGRARTRTVGLLRVTGSPRTGSIRSQIRLVRPPRDSGRRGNISSENTVCWIGAQVPVGVLAAVAEEPGPNAHGRNPAEAFGGGRKVDIAHQKLKHGGRCPERGKATYFEKCEPRAV